MSSATGIGGILATKRTSVIPVHLKQGNKKWNFFKGCSKLLEVSVSEIVEELPKLDPEQLEKVYFQVSALIDVDEGVETPELLEAIDEAEASYENEGSIDAQEMCRLVKSWKPTK
ncbi:MAG: hypothetical protein AAGA64_18995 [Bacteroidota bacterium]